MIQAESYTILKSTKQADSFPSAGNSKLMIRHTAIFCKTYLIITNNNINNNNNNNENNENNENNDK